MFDFLPGDISGVVALGEAEKTALKGLKNNILSSPTATTSTYVGAGSNARKFVVFVYSYEIYNNEVYNLLQHSSIKPRTADKSLTKKVKKTDKIFYVLGLTYVPVSNREDAMGVLNYARGNSSIGNNGINKTSSRSHTVLGFKLLSADDSVPTPNLAYVDTAGREGRTPDQMALLSSLVNEESVHINKSIKGMHFFVLFFFKRC